MRTATSASCRAPPPRPRADQDADLVAVLEVHDSFALGLATSTLEDADISYMIGGEQPRYLIGPMGFVEVGEMPLCKCHSVIQVAREDEGEVHWNGSLSPDDSRVPPEIKALLK